MVTSKPTTPTTVTSGPSGNSLYVGQGDPPVQPTSEHGLTIFVTDSFQGSRPWPPKNVVYAIQREPKSLYVVIQADLSVVATSLQATVFCGQAPLLTQPVSITPNSTVYLQTQGELGASHCVERVFLNNGTHLTFPFIVVELERGSNPGEFKRTIQDPDATPLNLSNVWLQRGMAQSKEGQHQAAIHDFTVAIQADDITGYQLRANEYATLNDYERAITDYDEALRWQPHSVWCLVNRGSAYANLGNGLRAIADYTEALRINPTYQPAVELLARVRKDFADREEKMGSLSAGSGEGVPSMNQREEAQDCYTGSWQENEANAFTWSFERQDNVLRIRRNDGFVSGEFQKSQDGWTGFLNWGNGTTWNGVVLHDANEACDEIATNQRWWYRR